MKHVFAILCALALTGCASTEYASYAEAHKAQAAAQTARYQALADIAKQGDTTAKVAAVMSLQMGGGQQSSQIAAPKSWADYAMQWTGMLLPTIGQIYTVNKQTSLGMKQSDNATALGVSTNAAFVGIASQIQAPAANVSTVSNTSNSSTVGANSGANSGNTSNTRSVNTATSTVGPNSGTNSGNSGRLAGTSITDSTSAPTVVTQPAPIVVTQPAPVIVPTTTPPAPAPVP